MNELIRQLTTVFATNFVVYYKSHVAHVNTVGREFYSDHKLLQKIYEDAQESIDTYAEYLRTLEAEMPDSLVDVCDSSEVSDGLGPRTSGRYLQAVYDDTETLIEQLDELYTLAEECNQFGLSGFVQERLTAHRRFCWMLRSSLE
jgi:DNA-binding ferritin-like protein